MTWTLYGISAGLILGLYDIFTKHAMTNNGVFAIVLWSSTFGALAWIVAGAAFSLTGVHGDVWGTSLADQLWLVPKGAMMTLSWIFAYFAVRELSISFAGAVRASGPVLTFVGGLIVFGETLTWLQSLALGLSTVAYYIFAVIGRREGLTIRSVRALLFMLGATLLSSLTTVYDKALVQRLSLDVLSLQLYSALHRFIFSAAIAWFFYLFTARWQPLRWSWSIPLVGIAWVGAELVHFAALSDPDAQVAQLAIFRRASLIVAFAYSAIVFQEKNVAAKSAMIALLILSIIFLIVS
ncbi:MAG: DMT family transporter [Xanthobacteraceae bacterium]